MENIYEEAKIIAEYEFDKAVRRQAIDHPEAADNLAGDIAGDIAAWKKIEDQTSDEFDAIMTACNEVASRLYPGDY